MKNKFTILTLITTAYFSGTAQCDTVFNLRSTLDTPSLIVAADTGVSPGYLSGNNAYGDIAKAEAFAVDSGFYLRTAFLYFGYVTINPTDTSNIVMIYAWDNTGISLTGNNAPGVAIDSAPVTLGKIAEAVTDHKSLRVFFTGDSTLKVDTIY